MARRVCRGPAHSLVMMRAKNLYGPFFQNTGQACVKSVGNAWAPGGPLSNQSVLEFDALGADNTGRMTGVLTGTGGLAEARASSLWLPDYEGKLWEFGANEPGWSGGRVVENLLLQSGDLSASPWLGSAVVTNKTTLTGDASNEARRQDLPDNLAVGDSIVVKVVMEKGDGQSCRIAVGDPSVTTGRTLVLPVSAAPVEFVLAVTLTDDLTPPRILIYPNVSDPGVSHSVDIVSAQFQVTNGQSDLTTPGEYQPTTDSPAIGVYRTDYSGNDLPELPYVVAAPEATNLIDTSVGADSGTRATINENYGPDIAGGSENCSIVPNALDNSHWALVNGQSIVSGETYYFSTHVKAAGYDWVSLSAWVTGFTSTAYVNFNLSNGSVGTVGVDVVDYGIEPLADDTYRVWISAEADASAAPGALLAIAPFSADVGSKFPTFPGDETSGVLAWGHQVELDRITPYNPTDGSPVTRDACALSFDLANHDNDNGAYYCEFEIDGTLSTSGIISTRSSASGEMYAATNNVLRSRDGTNSSDCAVPGVGSGSPFKAGVVYDAGEATKVTACDGSTDLTAPFGAEGPYDGAYDTSGGKISIGMATDATLYMRRLQRWSGDFEDLKAKLAGLVG